MQWSFWWSWLGPGASKPSSLDTDSDGQAMSWEWMKLNSMTDPFQWIANWITSHGHPLKRYKDQLKQMLQKTNINIKTWETIAWDRPLWRRTIHEGSDHFERMRREEAEEKWHRRKARATLLPAPATIFCDQCPRIFRARIGLISHKQAFHPSWTKVISDPRKWGAANDDDEDWPLLGVECVCLEHISHWRTCFYSVPPIVYFIAVFENSNHCNDRNNELTVLLLEVCQCNH